MTDYTELKLKAEHAVGFTDISLAPDVVLALITENDCVKARLCVCRDCGGQGEVYSGHSSYQGHNQPPEPDMDVCGTCGGDGVLGPLEDFEALADERDQLKAENEALRKRVQDLSPFKGAPLTGPSLKCLACGGYHYGMQGLPCPNMRITAQAELPDTRSGQIGAALFKGEQP